MDELIRFDELRKVLEQYGKDVQENYKDQLQANDAVASRKLIDGVKYQVTEGKHTFDVELRLQDYWKYVDNGTKPHWPPTNKILEWIKVKPVVPRADSNGKLPTEKQLAYLISRKIARYGIKPRPMLRDTLDTLNTFYLGKIEEALSRDIDRALTLIMTF